jgi:hypothetical protein
MNENNILDEMQEEVVVLQAETEVSEEIEEVIEETEVEEVATPKQSKEENAKYAAARREAESERKEAERRAAELEEKTKQMQKQLDSLVNATKLYGYEGSPEEISDQLIASQREITPEEVKREREQREKEIESIVNSHPAVLQAQTLAMQVALEKELQEIQKINPEIRSLNDLQGNPEFDELVIKNGVSLSKAYKLTYKQPTLPKENTKEHLTGINTGDKSNDGLVDIPQSELGYFKDSFPDEPMSKLKERYNRILKRQKGE